MSDATQTTLRIALESTYDTVPTSGWQDMLFTAESLQPEVTQAKSEEIQASRNYRDIMRLAESGGGPLDCYLVHGAYDELWLGAMCASGFAAQGNVIGASTSVSAAAADDSFNLASGDWSANVDPAQWIHVAGFANASNNGYFKVVSDTATKIVVANGAGIVNESAGPSVTITRLARTVNAKSKRSYAAEALAVDLVDKYKQATGLVILRAVVSFSNGAPITGSFTMQGARVRGVGTPASGSTTAASANKPMTAGGNVFGVLEGYLSIAALRGSISIANNIQFEERLGSLTPVGFNLGMFDVSGDLELYFKDHTQVAKFEANTESSLTFIVQGLSSTGTVVAYVFDIPAVKFGRGDRVSGGQNQHVVLRVPWEAIGKSSEGITMGIHRLTL